MDNLIAVLKYLTIFCIVLYVLNKIYQKYNYWARHGVIFDKPLLFFGSLKNVVFGREPTGIVYKRIYTKFRNQTHVGIFVLTRPSLLIISPKLAHKIMVTNLRYFYDRQNADLGETGGMFSETLLFLKGLKWRLMRKRLTPMFSGGKLKNMFSTLKECAQAQEKLIVKHVEDGGHLVPRDFTAAFATSAIGKAILSVDTGADQSVTTLFQKISTIEVKLFNSILQLATVAMPKLAKTLRLKIFEEKFELFFNKIVEQNIVDRRSLAVKPNDLMNSLIEMLDEGTIKDNETDYEYRITPEVIAAQIFFFFIAGVDTSASTIDLTFYELSKNPDILAKLLDEIDTVFAKGDDNITFETVETMKYLNKVITEVLRLYPVIGQIERECTEDFYDDEYDIHFRKGGLITIPLLGLQRDPSYYPDPEKFDPERFSPERKMEIPSGAYIPFGEGNRNCIGMRFTLILMKLSIIYALRSCIPVRTEETVEKIEFLCDNILMRPKTCGYKFEMRKKHL